MATAMTTVYYIPPMDKFILRHPYVTLRIYIDDISLTATGADDATTAKRLADAGRDLEEVIKTDLKCRLAPGKEALVASTKGLEEAVRAELGELAGARQQSVANLGVDFTAGKKR